MKKILITNGSLSDLPLIEAAHELGLYVITSGNNPSLCGHELADQYINCDYSKCDKMLEIAKKNDIDFICASANDFGAITASYISEKMRLGGHDSYETTLLLHHKDKFRKFAMDNKLITPKAISFVDENEAIKYAKNLDGKVVVKPVDMGGGKGITFASNYEEYIKSIEYAFRTSPSKHIVIEEFIEGTYHSFSTFIVDKKVKYCYSDNEYFDNYLCIVSGGPADNISKTKETLIEQCNKIASLMNLVDGRLHIQYVLDKKGNPYPLEYTRRCSGDLYTIPESKALGFNTALNIVKAECGFDVKNVPNMPIQQGFTGRHIILADHNAKIKNVVIDERLRKHIFDEKMLWDDGYEIKNYRIDRIGIISYFFSDREEMMGIIKNINKYINIYYY